MSALIEAALRVANGAKDTETHSDGLAVVSVKDVLALRRALAEPDARPEESSGRTFDPREAALASTRPENEAVALATIYVGDQLARQYDEHDLSNQDRLAIVRNDALTTQARAMTMQVEISVEVAKQLKRIADVFEESHKVGGTMHAIPTTLLLVEKQLKQVAESIPYAGQADA